MASADTTTLGTPIADGGIAAVNFFNGRLLTGKDLSREQDARRLADQRVGQALGAGTAWGLEVGRLAGAAPGEVRISAGVGVSLSGQVLRLAGDTVARLVPPSSIAATTSSASFGACAPLSGGSYVAGDGLYLLTLAPTLKADGTAPVLALDSTNLRCNTDAWIEAVQLRLLPVPMREIPATDARSLARFRNQVAHDHFGSSGVAAAHARAGTAAGTGTLEAMLDDGLSRCDVPLALVYMVGPDILFIEAWAVRRRVAADAAPPGWAPWAGLKAQALAEARMMQFQVQLAEDAATLLGRPAADTLDWLPPAGFLPPGTVAETFFGGRMAGPAMPLAPGDAPGLLAAALAGDAVRIVDAADKARFRVYRIESDGSLLFLRDARNVHAAEQLWLDGPRAGLPTLSEVQSAVDALRAGSCLEVALWSGMSTSQMAKAIASGRGRSVQVNLCFEAGEYLLGEPLRVTGLGRVHIQGRGAKLVNAKGECALYVADCAGVVVQDLAVEGRASGTGKDLDGIGIYGALTVVDTDEVAIERVQAACAPSRVAQAQAAGIVAALSKEVQSKGSRTQRVAVADCRVTAGARQYGILVSNASVSRLQRNMVNASGSEEALFKGIVVAGQTAEVVQLEGNLVRGAACGIAVGLSKSETVAGEPLQAGRVRVAHNRSHLRLTGVEATDRYGIFVGNAQSALVEGNHVTVESGDALELQLQGLRLHGTYGPQLLVRDNLVEGAWCAINFQPVSDPPGALRLFSANVLVGGGSEVLQVSKTTAAGLVAAHNLHVKGAGPAVKG